MDGTPACDSREGKGKGWRESHDAHDAGAGLGEGVERCVYDDAALWKGRESESEDLKKAAWRAFRASAREIAPVGDLVW